jgi:hypothetical protein
MATPDTLFETLSPGDGLERRVHTFYYADNIGFIGYDELDGNEWRRK